MQLNDNKEFIFYLTSTNKSCEVAINFDKTVKFDEPMKCSLSELIIPNKLYPKDLLNGLEMKCWFKWITIEHTDRMDKVLMLDMGSQHREDQPLAERFDLDSIDDLFSKVQQIINRFNNWVDSIIKGRYPDILSQVSTPLGLKDNIIEKFNFRIDDNGFYNIKHFGKLVVVFRKNFTGVYPGPLKHNDLPDSQGHQRSRRDTGKKRGTFPDVMSPERAKKFNIKWKEDSVDTNENSRKEKLISQSSAQPQQPLPEQSSSQPQQPLPEQSSAQPQQPLPEQSSSQPQQPLPEQSSAQPQQLLTVENDTISDDRPSQAQREKDKEILRQIEQRPEPEPNIPGQMTYEMRNQAVFYIEINDKLRNLLGITDNTGHRNFSDISNINSDLKGTSNEPIITSIEDEINFLNIHCDVIEETFINNKKSNILRVIPLDKSSGRTTTQYYFEKNLFIPLRINELESLGVSIKDQLNRNLFFTRGNLLAMLLIEEI